MLARIRKSQENGEGGFTLIELLVVMIIIGILAAIAIPAFLNQKKKAKETSAKSDVSTIGKEIAAFYVDGTGALSVDSTTKVGSWTILTGTTVVSDGKLSAGNAATATTSNIVSDAAWCVQVATADNVSWKYSAVGGLSKGTCSGTA